MARKTVPFKIAPPPWTCKCTAYVLPFFYSASSGLPTDLAYAPLEAVTSSFSSQAEAGAYKGGLCLVQIIRYIETPVGSYDELAIVPGDFGVPGQKEQNMRITRIYVSQKDSCYNGRKNWNIPKHLARFEFIPLSQNKSSSSRSKHVPPPLRVSVFAPDGNAPPSAKPFFTTTLQPINYLPSWYSFPFNSTWATYFGFSSHMAQPPLPAGETKEECGSDTWIRSKPELSSKKTRAIWWDMQQEGADQSNEGPSDSETDSLLSKKGPGKALRTLDGVDNWWPGLGRWRIGLWLDDAVLTLGEAEEMSVEKKTN